MDTQNDKNTLNFSPDTPSKCTWATGNDIKNSPHRHVQITPSEEKILPNILSQTRNTPIVRINKLNKDAKLKCELLAKCEYFNAGGSVKDRIGRRMIEDAEEKGLIKPGDVIIEPTAGNTGIGLALAACVKGYKCIFVMPEYMSMDKVNILHALGAEIVRSPNTTTLDSPDSDFGVAHRLQKEIANSIILNQFRNAENPLVHYDETAEEILQACDGKLDMFIACTGTGGTITGVGRKLKEKCPQCKVIGVRSEAIPGKLNEVEGLKRGFIPTTLDTSIIDKWYECSNKDSFICARRLISEEGLLCDDWMIDRKYLEKQVSTKNQKWREMKVSSLDLVYSPTLIASLSCYDCINIMEMKGLEQMPVLDEKGRVIGIATMGNMNAQLKAGKVNTSTPVSSVTYKQFKKITLDTTLSKLSSILDIDYFSIVINEQMQSSESNDVFCKQTIAIVKKIDLLRFIFKQQEAEALPIEGI
ncbi:cystathionine beta-synthase-like [Saccoglossus kowalevskii]|uniref:Cystathionine beta-synthase-like n=1 Tax=Saccoglossus kowalevskii TaxID=10224 RepID=A0ABM0LYW3_SACKO|nr:PREDICTED: cystathionine beta-synthase-like [Saccoglossus kowalevskii]